MIIAEQFGFKELFKFANFSHYKEKVVRAMLNNAKKSFQILTGKIIQNRNITHFRRNLIIFFNHFATEFIIVQQLV